MRRLRAVPMTNIITLLTVFAMTACFSIITEPLCAASSSAEFAGGLVELNNFLDKAGEPVLLLDADIGKFTKPRIDFQRYFVLLGVICGGMAIRFSPFVTGPKHGSFDSKNPILIKLRI